MPRPKGYSPSLEERKKISASKRKEKVGKRKGDEEIKKYMKETLYYTGAERSGFEFWPLIRNKLRPLKQYVLLHIIEREIVQPDIWLNVPKVKEKLGEYFHLVKI